MGDETLYNYELKKTMLPGFLTKGIKIRDSWVSRCRRYLNGGEPSLSALINFINKGLVDRRREGFNEKALEFPLTISQKWLLMHLVLNDGVPEHLRDDKKDEVAPEMLVAEPIIESAIKSAVLTGIRPVTSLFKDTDGDGIPDEEDTDTLDKE
jgi:hypothetical protein